MTKGFERPDAEDAGAHCHPTHAQHHPTDEDVSVGTPGQSAHEWRHLA
ncbi:MAG: hypothetical protein WCA10_18285 [Terracidiphilus sp.]